MILSKSLFTLFWFMGLLFLCLKDGALSNDLTVDRNVFPCLYKGVLHFSVFFV